MAERVTGSTDDPTEMTRPDDPVRRRDLVALGDAVDKDGRKLSLHPEFIARVDDDRRGHGLQVPANRGAGFDDMPGARRNERVTPVCIDPYVAERSNASVLLGDDAELVDLCLRLFRLGDGSNLPVGEVLMPLGDHLGGL